MTSVNWLQNGNYKYFGCKVKSASIDTSTLTKNSQGIVWNPKEVNVGKLCAYKVTLQDKKGKTISIRGKLKILDIIETKQKNPSLVLQDQITKVIAGSDLEIQTSSFLNNQDTVMSKVLGCTIFKQTERKKLIHCDMPEIVNYEGMYPSLYCIKSNKSIYVGITHRHLEERVYEHCTLTKDKSVQSDKSTFDMIASLYCIKSNKSIYVGITHRHLEERVYEHCTLTKDKSVQSDKSTFDMIAHEGAKVYCIGEFLDHTLDEVANMTDEERAEYHHKMESVETLMITLAKISFPKLECINRKQVLTNEDRYKQNDKIATHIATLPFINFTLDFETMRQIGFRVNCDKYDSHELDKVIKYEGCPYRFYVSNSYYEKFIRICESHRDMRHFKSEYYFEYAMLTHQLLPHNLLFLVEKKMRRRDKREEKLIYFDTIHEQMENTPKDDQFYNYYKNLYDNRHLYKFTNRKWYLMHC